MKASILRTTAIRSIVAMSEGSRLIICQNRCFLLSLPPARLTAKIMEALKREGWIGEPHNIGSGIAEYRLTQKGQKYSEKILAAMENKQATHRPSGGHATL